ncbi:uncharacterized protein LOC135221093 [Macrobrachium nipponense]|uniref:uncharacterized protein LOC135221093 n=1 Tax=Macrobrachium nipponense TaxID=159736 RepID=UPI0030C8AFA9
MARSIKSKRGKRLRQKLRERYKKKADEHLLKIVEKAKSNDLLDISSLVWDPKWKKSKDNTEKMENEDEAAETSEQNVEDVKDEVKMEDGAENTVTTKGHQPKKKFKVYRGGIECLRDKNGALPKWLSQRKVRKAFINRKIKKNDKGKRKALRLL